MNEHHEDARGLWMGLLMALCIVMLSMLGCSDDEAKSGPVSTAPPTTTSAPVLSAVATDTTASVAEAGDTGGAAPGLPEDDGLDTAPAVSGSAPPPVAKVEPKVQPKVEPKPTPAPAQPAPLPEPTAQAPPPEPAPVATAEPVVPAEKGSADEVAARVDEIFGPVQRFRARFNQQYWAKVHDKTKNSKGILYVLKPGKLSLSYQKPNNNRAVSDGSTLKVYEAENKQMFVKSVANTEYPGAFAFILGKGLRSSFTFKFHKTSKFEGGPVILGTPRVPNPGYQSVLFYVDDALLQKGDLGAIRRVLVIDAQGNRNRFDFIHAEQPEKINDSEFIFDPPKGTEIIKG